MGEQRVRVGVIGAGRFAEEAHIPGVQAHPRGEVVALCARNEQRASALAARFGIPRVYTEYRALLAQPDIDAVTVAAPDALHLPIALAALQAGKHVFCEKPLARDAVEARRMAAAAEQSGLVHMVSFTFRYTRALQELRRLVRAGVLGTPFYVAMHVHWGGVGFPDGALTWREQAGQSPAGIWADGASHLFDALAFILAPAQEVCAQMMVVPREPGAAQPDSVDMASCLARLRLPRVGDTAQAGASAFAEREPGSVHATLLTSRMERPYGSGDEIQVAGTRGVASIGLSRGVHERASLLRAGAREWEDIALPDDAGGGEPLALTRMMGAYIDGVLRGRLDPERDASFAQGLQAQLAIDAALRSAHESRWERVETIP